MIVNIEIPELEERPDGFPAYWLQSFFIGTVSNNFQIYALANTYIRLVEASAVEYRLGRAKVEEFWNTHDSFNLTAMHRCIAHFDACVLDVHRALRCYIRLRKHKELSQSFIAMLTEDRPAFIADQVTKKVREVRNEIHHLEEKVMNGRIQRGISIWRRDAGHPAPPPQTRTCGFPASGSPVVLASARTITVTRFMVQWLFPSVRLARVDPVRQCPARVSFEGYILPWGPSPCARFSRPQTTMPHKTPHQLVTFASPPALSLFEDSTRAYAVSGLFTPPVSHL